MRKKQYRNFESARKFAQKLGLKSRDEWIAHCKLGNKPEDIPVSAGSIYKKDFKDWPDFLGYNRISKYTKSNTRPFEDARKFARSLKLKGGKEWIAHCKSGNNPEDVPSHPDRTYKNKGWNGMGDWLGNGTVASKNMKDDVFLSFEEARKFVRELKLKNTSAWNEYRKSKDKPDNITSTPNTVYKNEGWASIPDWLGNENPSNILRDFLSYPQCSKLIQKNHITTREQLRKYRKSCTKSDRDIIPGHPWDVYKKQGTWTSWGDFTGTGKEANQHRKFKSYKDAKIFAISLNLKGQKEWQKYTQSNKIPKDIPTAPSIFYKKQGTWTTWGDFLGTGTIANKNKEYLSVQEAKPTLQKLYKEYGIASGSDWQKFAKTHKKLLQELHLPADILVFYSKEKYEKSLKK